MFGFICFKELTHMIMSAGISEISRPGWHTGDPGKLLLQLSTKAA